jgi:hypothetical protein
MNTSELPAVALARESLANEIGCAPESITVAQIDDVEWSDSSLGCAQPGMMYMQVITPGYRIVLEQSGRRYTYHTDRGRRAVRCDHGQPPASIRPTI